MNESLKLTWHSLALLPFGPARQRHTAYPNRSEQEIMEKNKKNLWLSDAGKQQRKFYANSADVIILERQRAIKLLLDIFSYHFEDPTDLNILDLGCGDGFITEYLFKSYPHNNFFLIDGSGEMITKAQARLKNQRMTFIRRSFEEYIELKDEFEKYNFVFSSMAIHHLNFNQKSSLYLKLYGGLCENGLFINFDVVLPTSKKSEEWQFYMWRDGMNETLSKNGLESEIGTYDNLPDIYKSKEENQPSNLFDQLDLLIKIGFKDVDCFFKYGIFALFGGIK